MDYSLLVDGFLLIHTGIKKHEITISYLTLLLCGCMYNRYIIKKEIIIMAKSILQELHLHIAKSIMSVEPVFTYAELHEKIIELCNLINKLDDVDWHDEQYGETLDSIVVGAFWHYSEWHGGQNDITYSALSQLGTIYSPGMTSGVEEGSGEESIYQQLEQLAESSKGE